MTTVGRPTISVIVPARNRAHVIRSALASVYAQTFQDVEVIVVDDASDDDLAGAIADVRVQLIRLEKRRGAGAARNAALPLARGEWIAFLDSDDEWLPEKLERQIEAVTTMGFDAVYCATLRRRAGEEPAVRPKGTLASGDIVDALLQRKHAPTPSAYMVRRTALVRVRGFDETLPSAADFDLWLRLATQGSRFAAVQEPLVIKHDAGNGQMKQDAAGKAIGFRRMDQRWGPLVRERLGARAYQRWHDRRLRRIARKQEDALQGFVAAGNRTEALRYAQRMAAVLPWSRNYVGRAIGLAVAGPSLYTRVATAVSSSSLATKG